MSIEIFRLIPNYPDYMVSSYGRVFSFNRLIIMNPANDKDGYSVLDLYKDAVAKQYKVHRLVALAFIPNPYNKPKVDHINTKPSDNRLINLRWVTNSENGRNSKISKNNKQNVKGVCLTKRGVKRYRAYITIEKVTTTIGYFKTLEEAKEARMKKANEIYGEYTNACERIQTI